MLVVTLGGGAGIWRLYFYRSPINKAVQALQTAYRARRPLEARLCGFAYAPFADLRGQAAADDDAQAVGERLLYKALPDNPSVESRHALGAYYLAGLQYDRAIDELKTALESEDRDARLHNDLGAALFEKGRGEVASDQEGRVIEAFAESLAHLNRALTLEPGLQEALFNRALLHQHMMLTQCAAEDWREYLEKDSGSLWADEARRHLNRLEESQREIEQSQRNLVRDFLDACRAGDAERGWALFSPNREKLTTELLATYLRGSVRPQENAAREALDALTYAGELDAGRVGDRYTANVTHFYQSASARKLAMAGKAREMMVRASELYGQGQVEKAAELRDQAGQVFLRSGDVCGARLATYWLALHRWEMGQRQQSQLLLDSLLRACEADHYHWLRARTLYQRATIALKLNEHSNAIAYYHQAQELADRINDPQIAVDARDGLIEKYRLLGNRSECFKQIALIQPRVRVQWLGLLPLWRHFNFLAMTFATFGLHDAAIDHARESLRFATAANNFTMLSYCYAHLGLTYGKAQHFEEAFDHVQKAYDIAAAHAEKSLGQLMMAYSAVQMGHLYRQRGEHTKAIDKYDQAIELHRLHALDFPTHLYQAYKGRLSCYMALKDTAAAQQQLATLLELLEGHRARIFEEENRDNFFDVEQNVYDMGIDLAYSQLQNPREALGYAEASRARSLLDSVSAASPVIERGINPATPPQQPVPPLSLDEIQNRIPTDARLLEYAVLDEKLLIWVVSRDSVESVPVSVSQAALTDLVNRFLAAIETRSEAESGELTRLGRELFAHLIAPVEGLLGGSRKLIIVPDKALNRLPWDALTSPAGDRLLLQDYLVLLSPSATLFAICTDRAAQKADGRNEHILSVGNPRFDARAFPLLKQLPAAEYEAKRISKLYSSSQLLVGPDAREPAIRAELAHADLAHFALHCLVNERSAMLSSLVLAKEPGAGASSPDADGLLQAYEIYGLRLPRLRLVVLAACQTGVERYYRGEGMIGMARAFLVARVPLVVASLWPVDSPATADLMIQFHEYRKSMPSAEALREAKLWLLRQSSGRYHKPYYWAGFEAIGGQASF